MNKKNKDIKNIKNKYVFEKYCVSMTQNNTKEIFPKT